MSARVVEISARTTSCLRRVRASERRRSARPQPPARVRWRAQFGHVRPLSARGASFGGPASRSPTDRSSSRTASCSPPRSRLSARRSCRSPPWPTTRLLTGLFWRVSVKPGKPISFGVRGGTLVFGLPGNPVSSLVCFELFVRPAVLALQGASDPGPTFWLGELAASVKRNDERDQLLRARLHTDAARVVLEPLRGQESHMIARTAGADALALVPRGEGTLEAGAAVRYLRLG